MLKKVRTVRKKKEVVDVPTRIRQLTKLIGGAANRIAAAKDNPKACQMNVGQERCKMVKWQKELKKLKERK